MRNKIETLRRIVSFINNTDEQGGLWLPNIQRKFVWSPDQIESLFDSIMREYPISTLLIWKTNEEIKTRKFIENYSNSLKMTDYYRLPNDKNKLLVLDGQQRLQSLYIALQGSYEGKELYIDILSGLESNADNNIKYIFKFLETDISDKKWRKFKDLVFSNKPYDELAENIVDDLEEKELSIDDKKLIRSNVARIVKLFKTDDVISYQELDSVEYPETYNTDDIVEVFIRANSGGTKLEKSDLLFSLLISNWNLAEEEIELLQTELNKEGYNFTRDFILKTCLCLIDAGSKYDVNKFRKKENLEKIEENWGDINNAIKDVKDFIYGKTFIKSDKALPSYLSLIPIIYFRYHYKEDWDKGVPNLNNWILRILLTGAFSGSPDGLIDQINRKINEKHSFSIDDLNQLILNAGRNINVTEDVILKEHYSGKGLYLLFNLWYSHFDFTFVPAYKNNAPQIDHIFPQSKLKEIKVTNPETGRKVMKYKDFERNQIANCMLLTLRENGAGGKGAIPPNEWFADKDDDYLDMHLIPKNPELWKMENYEDFIEERKKILVNNFMEIINK